MPTAAICTFSDTKQLPEAGIVPPFSRIPVSPGPTAPPDWSSTDPPQVVKVAGVVATVIAPGVVGKVSVKPGVLIATA